LIQPNKDTIARRAAQPLHNGGIRVNFIPNPPMQSQAEQWFDIDLQRVDIQGLNSADAIAAFFAQLRYHTETRTTQTAGNLGIAADTTARPIKKIDLIADQEGLFQVYLFELQSITVAHTRALARAFRNRAGNYLLVLATSDYQRARFRFFGARVADGAWK
jgi:hypothetical protein